MCPRWVWAYNFLIEIQFAKALKHSLLVEEILTSIFWVCLDNLGQTLVISFETIVLFQATDSWNPKWISNGCFMLVNAVLII